MGRPLPSPICTFSASRVPFHGRGADEEQKLKQAISRSFRGKNLERNRQSKHREWKTTGQDCLDSGHCVRYDDARWAATCQENTATNAGRTRLKKTLKSSCFGCHGHKNFASVRPWLARRRYMRSHSVVGRSQRMITKTNLLWRMMPVLINVTVVLSDNKMCRSSSSCRRCGHLKVSSGCGVENDTSASAEDNGMPSKQRSSFGGLNLFNQNHVCGPVHAIGNEIRKLFT